MSRWQDIVAQVRALVSSLREMLQPGKRGRIDQGELTWQHPQLRHGVYLRNSGIVDVQARGGVIGVGPYGVSVEGESGYFGLGRLVVRCDRLAFMVPPDGYLLSGRMWNPALVSGRSVLAPLWDARLMVEPGSLRRMHHGATPPQPETVMVGNTPVQLVNLSELVEPLPFTLEQKERSWVDEAIRVLQRGLEVSSL